jgi:hypothetical protein
MRRCSTKPCTEAGAPSTQRTEIRVNLKFLTIAGSVLALTLLGTQASLAATSATQAVTFTVAKAVSISSGGDKTISTAIDPSSGTPTGTTTGTLTIQSNDAGGFQIAANTGASTVTESGSCTPSESANVNIMSISASTPTGGTGSAGTAAAAFALSTTATNLYSTAPQAVGSSMAVTTSYTVSPGWSTPANTSGCNYKITVNLAISAL